jgi:hypothetical protein
MQVQPSEICFQGKEVWLLNIFSALTGGSLSPEVCGEIVQWTRMNDLPFLARTCKSFQIASEKKLYDILMLGNPTVAFEACRTIATTERLGPYVRELYVYQEERRFRSVALNLQFWQVVQAAMNQMCHLEKLYIHDPSGQNTFILDPDHLNFQLDDVQLRMNWDDHVVAFLKDQRCLDRLTILRGPDNFEHPLGPDVLPHLKQFVGAITVATQLLVCPLTHLQVYVDESSSVPLLSFIPRLVKTGATLRSLSIIHLPDPIALDALHLISTSCPKLCYVGILPFASRHVSSSLSSLH